MKEETTNDIVTITISKKTLQVIAVENNEETENFGKARVSIGDRLPRGLRALMLMNPNRFRIIDS